MTEEIAMEHDMTGAQDAPAPTPAPAPEVKAKAKAKARTKAKARAKMATRAALDILLAARQAAPHMTEVAWCHATGVSYNHWCVLRRGESIPSLTFLLRAGDLAELRLCWAVQDAPPSMQTDGDCA